MESSWTGEITVEQCSGRSAATRVYARYPLKFILPCKVATSGSDAVWVYLVTYGGGILSGDCIACRVSVGDGCTMVLTTQASTKIYKSVQDKYAEQVLEATVGSGAILVALPDPVTCFRSAKYRQIQRFNVSLDGSLVLVDWYTSGRRERGEVWCFDSYKSTNNVYLNGEPLFLDSMCLEQDISLSVAERMQGFHSVAMLVIYGPRVSEIRKLVHERVRALSREVLKRKRHNDMVHGRTFLCSCSSFGPSDNGLVVRVLAETTELVYNFLKEQLSELAQLIGAPPYYGK